MITVFVFESDRKRFRVPPKVHPVEKNPILTFAYPSSKDGGLKVRAVRLIAANHKYFFGLDMWDHNRIKKFCRHRIVGNTILEEFNPEALAPKKKTV